MSDFHGDPPIGRIRLLNPLPATCFGPGLEAGEYNVHHLAPWGPVLYETSSLGHMRGTEHRDTVWLGDDGDEYVIRPTSCRDGGRWAWLRLRREGGEEMVGCTCHYWPVRDGGGVPAR